MTTQTSIFRRILDRNDLVLGDRVIVVDIRGDDPLAVHTVDRPTLDQFPVETFGALDNPTGYDITKYPAKVIYRMSEIVDSEEARGLALMLLAGQRLLPIQTGNAVSAILRSGGPGSENLAFAVLFDQERKLGMVL